MEALHLAQPPLPPGCHPLHQAAVAAEDPAEVTGK